MAKNHKNKPARMVRRTPRSHYISQEEEGRVREAVDRMFNGTATDDDRALVKQVAERNGGEVKIGGNGRQLGTSRDGEGA